MNISDLLTLVGIVTSGVAIVLAIFSLKVSKQSMEFASRISWMILCYVPKVQIRSNRITPPPHSDNFKYLLSGIGQLTVSEVEITLSYDPKRMSVKPHSFVNYDPTKNENYQIDSGISYINFIGLAEDKTAHAQIQWKDVRGKRHSTKIFLHEMKMVDEIREDVVPNLDNI